MKNNRMLTGLLGLLLCLAMIIGMIPMIPIVSAVTDTAKKGCCTADHATFQTLGTEGAANPVQVSREVLKAGGDFRLVSDIEITVGGVSLASGTNLHIDLNGFTINTKKAGLIFDIYATFTLCDTSDEQTGTLDASSLSTSDGAVYIRDGGTFEFYGGTISGVNRGTSTKKCVAIYMAGAGSTVNMHGGKISGNSSLQGPAVYMNAGTFKMYGGEISGNNATAEGGAIYSKGTMIISGGSITKNSTASDTDNNDKAGAIYVSNGSLTISGDAEISNNSAGYRYQAVYVGGSSASSAAFTMTGGQITANNAGGAAKAFGSVAIGDGADCTITGASVINDDGVWVRNAAATEAGSIVSIKELKSGANIEMREEGDVDTTDETVVAPIGFPGAYTYNLAYDIVARMVLGNNLDIQFAVPAELAAGDVTINGAAATAVGTVEGGDYNGYSIYECYVKSNEMTKPFEIAVQKDGKTYTKTESVQAYAMRLLGTTTNNEVKTLLVDMLNYGAEAQAYFTSTVYTDPANALLSTEQQAAFADVTAPNVAGTARLLLENNLDIQIDVGEAYKGKTLQYTFVPFDGTEALTYNAVVEEEEGVYFITADQVVFADYASVITVKDGNETVATDSVQNYVGRQIAEPSDVTNLTKALMKFADSAYDYLA